MERSRPDYEYAERENAWLCLQQAIDDLTRLSNKIEKENGYVESESTDGNPGASLARIWGRAGLLER